MNPSEQPREHSGTKLRMSQVAEIQAILDASRFAVLATQREGQPHTSLVATTPVDGIQTLLFATYRSTRKYRNLLLNGRVALFFGDRAAEPLGAQCHSVLTAHGLASIAPDDERGELASVHLKRHPSLHKLLASTDSVLLRVRVAAYQLAHSIDDVRWFDLSDCTPL